MSEKILLTKEKYEQLKNELKELQGGRKKDLSETLESARLNDVSEDTDNITIVMAELDSIEQRIRELKETISNATILKRKGPAKSTIEIGSKVKVKNGQKTVTYQIVSEVESDPIENKISDKSPLGKALLKHKKGDSVKIELDGRKIEYKILDVA